MDLLIIVPASGNLRDQIPDILRDRYRRRHTIGVGFPYTAGVYV
jgi:hypothetical protein